MPFRLDSVDLRAFGAPARYVASRVATLAVEGREIVTDKPIIAIFDSGVTGAQVSNRVTQATSISFRVEARFRTETETTANAPLRCV